MATNGTFRRSVNSFLHLDLKWERTSVDIPNNRSLVRLTLQLVHSGTGIYFNAPKTGTLQGSGFTYSGGFSGSGTQTVATTDVWVNHNSDGSKSQSFSGAFNIAITYSGSWLGSISVSGTANLDRIPRASTIESFSNFTLQPNQSNSFSLSLSRVASSFTHNITLRVSGTDIQSWNGQGLPTSLSLSSAASNQILNIMRNSTSVTVELRVQTRSGSTNIGGVLTRNATASVHSSVAPAINSISVSEQVSNIATDLGEYVQYHSRLAISVSTTAGYGARDDSTRITVNGQTFNSKTATTATLKTSGTNTIAVRYVNTRGQVVNDSRTVIVRQYSPPQPRVVNVYRSNGDGTKNDDGEFATVEFENTISSINNKNSGIYQLRYKQTSENIFKEETIPQAGTHTFLAGVDHGYDIQVVASDYFDTRTAYGNVTSTFSLINFSADGKGMAFGGAYDESVGGVFQAYGEVTLFNGLKSIYIPEGADLNNYTNPGFYFNHLNAEASNILNLPNAEAFSLLVEKHAGVKQTVTRYYNSEPRTWIRNHYLGAWGSWFEVQFK